MSFNTWGTVCTIIGLAISLLSMPWGRISWEEDWKQILLCVLFLIAITYFVCVIHFKSRKRNKCSSELRKFQQESATIESSFIQNSKEKCKFDLIRLCNSTSKAFSEYKGSQISICIKFINTIDNVQYIELLCRDFQSMEERKKFPNLDVLNDNSDFKSLILKHDAKKFPWHEIHFCKNNLPLIYGYYNSHLDDSLLDNGLWGFFTRHFYWTLPYKSTLIVPISDPGTDSLYAFLCLDSKKSYCFVESEDVDLARNVTLSLWRIVNTTIKKLKSN